jgi:alpha-acetolactate decarboxylase
MANSQFTSKSVEAAEDLLKDIKDKARAANEANDVFMMGIFKEVLDVVSPIVTKSITRYHRQERAEINKQHKALREKMRESKE